ncbi:MAG TPA: L,D-transpeptidase [Dehalococcoidia bacterium]|nr:L,D-transpeptidase [Dehalococcoidia bacterium]
MPRRTNARCLLALALLLAVVGAACGQGEANSRLVTVEPLMPTPTVMVGGKPATPPVFAPSPTPPPVATPASAPEDDAAAPSPTPEPETAAEPTATAAPALASDGSVAPAAGRWIEVDVTTFTVRLMDGATVLREFSPVAVGAQIDTGEYLSTQTGLFHVHTKIEGLAYDAPFDTYISHWVGFDAEKANGFHSLLKDAAGNVVDASTGRVSNGCIRVAEIEEVYAFAEIGMPVWVHW